MDNIQEISHIGILKNIWHHICLKEINAQILVTQTFNSAAYRVMYVQDETG